VIEARGIRVVLGDRPVVDGVDLSVASGEWVSIVDPKGAGKSTLLRYLTGAAVGDGEVRLDGRAWSDLSRRERALVVALVPQTPVIPSGIRVVDYVLLGRTPHIRPLGVEGPADLAAVHDALSHLDLLELADREVTTLSGGERQRVLIARALAQGASLVLLDEPTTALDVGHQQQVLELVDELRHRHGLTVVTTMHDLTLAGQYADRLLLLDTGRVVAEGPADEVLTADHVARYYGASVRVISEGGRPVVLPVRTERRERA
jgi:iron complex transport system ATP-binding protein